MSIHCRIQLQVHKYLTKLAQAEAYSAHDSPPHPNPQTKNNLVQNVHSAKVEKPRPVLL